MSASLLIGLLVLPPVLLDHVGQLDDVLALLVLLRGLVGLFLLMMVEKKKERKHIIS